MANAIYPKYKQSLLAADANVKIAAGADVRVMLIDTGTYTYSATHQFKSDVAGGAIISTSPTLTNNVAPNGLFDADDAPFTAVSGATVEAIIVYIHDGGADGARRLVAYFDTGVTGLPLTPNGGDVTVQWNLSGIFLL